MGGANKCDLGITSDAAAHWGDVGLSRVVTLLAARWDDVERGRIVSKELTMPRDHHILDGDAKPLHVARQLRTGPAGQADGRM